MKKVDFLFIYEVRSREIENLALLAAQLEHWGYTTAFMNSWRCLDLKYDSYDAQVVVISACYDTGTYQFFAGHAGKFKKVVDLQWEQVLKNGYIQSREIVSWDFSGEGLVTRHVCWGPNERKRLEDVYGVEEQYLPICGYLPMDFYRPELADFIIKREQLFTENGLDPNKMTVLFISSFAMVGLPNEHKGKCGYRLQEIIDDIPSITNKNEVFEIEKANIDVKESSVPLSCDALSVSSYNIFDPLEENKIENVDVLEEVVSKETSFLKEYKNNLNFIFWFNKLKKFKGKNITISKIRESFSSKSRPSIQEIQAFFDSLVSY
ncbi:MAG: hypothetical protein RSA20_08000, partial [Oscillospiraceae bacterium]